MMKMQNADVLVVCGVNATLLAWLSGKPYVVWPHGGDIRFASGSGFKYSNFFGRGVVTELRRWLLKRAYSCALYIGSHDPKGIAGHLMKKTYGVEWFPIPHPNRVSLDSSTDKHLILFIIATNVLENGCYDVPKIIQRLAFKTSIFPSFSSFSACLIRSGLYCAISIKE